jgi:hypothetical protein
LAQSPGGERIASTPFISRPHDPVDFAIAGGHRDLHRDLKEEPKGEFLRGTNWPYESQLAVISGTTAT